MMATLFFLHDQGTHFVSYSQNEYSATPLKNLLKSNNEFTKTINNNKSCSQNYGLSS